MWTYAARRLVLAVPTLFGVSVVAFVLVALSPGDPALAVLGDHYTAEEYAHVRESLGLDKPLPLRYLSWGGRILRGDLGHSSMSNRAVLEDVREFWPATAELTLSALFLACLVGIVAGVTSATQRGSFLDQASMMGALAGVSLPIFWLGGILLVLVTTIDPSWPTGFRLPSRMITFEPVTGFYLIDSLLQRRLDWFVVSARHLLLPAIALGTIPMALISRMTRSSMLEAMSQDFVRTARAKGLPARRVNYKHALRNALIPVVTIVGLQFGTLLGGAIITEQIFSWPGLGNWILKGLQTRDQNVIQAGVLVIACGFALINLVVDLAYLVIDPHAARIMSGDAAGRAAPRRDSEPRRMLRTFLRRRSAVVGLVLVGLLALAGLVGPVVAPYDPDFRMRPEQPPSAAHWFGTDDLGRDLLSGILHGARITLLVGFISVGIALSCGLVLGSLSAYVGGRLDLVLQRVIDVMMSFPSILLAILIAAITEKPSLGMAMVAVGIVGIPTYTRLVRATVLQQRELEYVLAARAMGASPLRILGRGILPNIVAPVVVQATLGFATAILEAAGLSFLGLGAQPPTKEWGLMVKSGWDTWAVAPWIITFPGACIFVAVMSLNLLGDGLRDLLDPRQRGAA